MTLRNNIRTQNSDWELGSGKAVSLVGIRVHMSQTISGCLLECGKIYTGFGILGFMVEKI